MRSTILNRASDGADDQVDGMVSSLTVVRDDLSNAESVSDDKIERRLEREREGEEDSPENRRASRTLSPCSGLSLRVESACPNPPHR